ncbi:carboxylating nicotinate-nucleotide diphosphorylase [Candidatus Photodesmus blepharus]|nr:carboxylating nicotinate-nucleotide diphosphorylase [Candidatus Photodesmus blepharus]
MKSIHNNQDRLNCLKQRLPAEITRSVANTLREDLGEDLHPTSDITANLISEDTCNVAAIVTREHGIFCGRAWADEIFSQLAMMHKNISKVIIEWHVQDGEKIELNQTLCTLSGSARLLLTGERNAINFMQTLSGCATTTSQYVRRISGTNCRILDTRKTIPGLRSALKYAVVCGGGYNHRIGVFDAYLIKENHITACGGIAHAIAAAKKLNLHKPIEIEIENLNELQQAIEAGADIVMLDNFNIGMVREAVKINAGRVVLENSGNINLENVRQYAETGVDYISIGRLTKNLKAMDFSMRFK